MMRPGALLDGENRLKRELKILEHQITTKQIDRSTAIERGHYHLERHLKEILVEVDEAAAEVELGEVDRGAPELQQLLERAKRDWIRIVDDLLAL